MRSPELFPAARTAPSSAPLASTPSRYPAPPSPLPASTTCTAGCIA
ncbi:hypothetical protein OROMI_010396 [Orobanche minor]